MHEDTILTRDPKQLLAAEKVILPGVGAFGDAMGKLKEYGLIDVISEIVDKNTPFLEFALVYSCYLNRARKALAWRGSVC